MLSRPPANCLGFLQDAGQTDALYPQAASKKGLQVQMVDDALALGVKHAALNVNLSQLIDPLSDASDKSQPQWTRDGQTFFYSRRDLERLDESIKPLSDNGVLVHLIILAYQSHEPKINQIMLHPGYDSRAPNRLGAFNTKTEEGRAWLAATMEFLSDRWSRSDQKYGRVAGYIVGNEVNSHWWWSNMGHVTFEQFANEYLTTIRMVHRAVRSQSSWARVYISLDHHWKMAFAGGDETKAFAGKDLIDFLGIRAREQPAGDFDWHVAYHPYPENLFDPRFWNDKTAQTNENTARITFKNLEVLTQYLNRPELLYDGQPRRVLLSEQGFHSPAGTEGETLQAAAFCYAYKKVEKLDGIDAFILHRHVDHPREGGLRLGLRSYNPGAADPAPVKKIYECFRVADSPDWEPTFEFSLPIIGIQSWD